MHTNVPNPRNNSKAVFLLIAISVALLWILMPFYGAILWGLIIALVFEPLHKIILPRVWMRPNLAAFLTLLIVLLLVIVPFAMITTTLAIEAAGLFQRLKSGELQPLVYFRTVFDSMPPWMAEFLARMGFDSFETLQIRLNAALTQAAQWIASQALNLGQLTFGFTIQLGITLYLAFFLIRDGDEMVHEARRLLPLAPAHTLVLFEKFNTVILASIKGNLIIALVQGILGGLAFWVLGVTGTVLWAVLMAFLSLVPAVGASLVWLPVALYFLLSGAIWEGIGLIAYGILVIGLVDNLLRPVLVGKSTRLPDYVVMITTLGGMSVVGVNGFVIGPLIAAMFVAIWHLYGITLHDAPADETPTEREAMPESTPLSDAHPDAKSALNDESR
jgi:predicted PurR-regulated permease PerM